MKRVSKTGFHTHLNRWSGAVGCTLLLSLLAWEQSPARADDDPPTPPVVEVRAFKYTDEFGNIYWFGGEKVTAYAINHVPFGSLPFYEQPGQTIVESDPAYDKDATMLTVGVDDPVLSYALARRVDFPLSVGLPPAYHSPTPPVHDLFYEQLTEDPDATLPPPPPVDPPPIDPPPPVDPPLWWMDVPTYGPYVPPDHNPPPDNPPPPPPPDDPSLTENFVLPPPKAPDAPISKDVSVPAATEQSPGVGAPGCGCPPGMAQYWGDLLRITLHLADRPLSYRPAFGPPVDVVVTYESPADGDAQPDFSVTNVGPGWSLNWVRYIMDVPTDPGSIQLGFGDGTMAPKYQVSYLSPATLPAGLPAGVVDPDFPAMVYARPGLTSDRIIRVHFNHYLHLLPDGGFEIYRGYADMDPAHRKLFLSDCYDRFGNHVSLAWQNNELKSIVDATGLSTQFAYEHGGHQLTKIIDPFGRTATLEYEGGRFKKITDPVGVTSQFTYENDNFISKLTTPYGDSNFTRFPSALLLEDPTHAQEYLCYVGGYSQLPVENPNTYTAAFPRTYESHFANTFYWGKRAMLAVGGRQFEDATVYHWLLDAGETGRSGCSRACVSRWKTGPSSATLGSPQARRSGAC